MSKLYVIWISDEIDRLLADDEEKIIAYHSPAFLKKYLSGNNIDAGNDITTYNVYSLQRWLADGGQNSFDCAEMLGFWNLFIDVAVTVNKDFNNIEKDTMRNEIYDKLYNGSGLWQNAGPNPVFSNEEIIRLKEILQNGVDMLLGSLAMQD